MALIDDNENITVTTFEDTSRVLTNLHKRVRKTEEVSEVVHRIWHYLKYATPILITALLSGVAHDSIAYKLGTAFVTTITGGN